MWYAQSIPKDEISYFESTVKDDILCKKAALQYGIRNVKY